jgi:hypothetical protein
MFARFNRVSKPAEPRMRHPVSGSAQGGLGMKVSTR